MAACAHCGSENPAEARFCNACGTPLAAVAPPRVEERKLVSVLFADLVGFTARSEQLDPEDVRAMLSPYYARLRAELERHGGTVEKFIGDAVMAVFGAPTAHEDDPERAVRAALAIRDWVVEEQPELQVRIAVATGEALVSLGARPSEGEGMAAGDVVNTTARLQAAAPVNGILVGERTHRATQSAIEYRPAEPVQAKGKAEPIPVWEVVEARSRFGVDVVQTGAEHVGRERELAQLRDALARATDERSVQLATVVGVPGIGKSRLVFELAQVLDAAPELVVWRQGRSLPYGEGVTYWALGEMVKAQAGILESDPAEVVVAKLREAVAAAMGGPAEADHVEAHLRPLVGLAGAGEAGGEHGAWRRFFEALAEDGPVVLVFEDLHWADDGMLDFVDHLVDWATGVPLLVICTARPELLERRPSWGGGKRNALTVSLSPLSEPETARLIGALLARNVLPAETQSALLARAGGNPLYTEQFVRMLLERGQEDLPLPENVQGIIAARLDGLDAEDKALLQAAAVFGKVFWLGAVAAVAPGTAHIEERLHALERKEFIRRERRSSVADETEYAFQHLLVRDVAYGQMPRAVRADRHLLAAEWMESLGRPADHADMLAHHFSSAGDLARSAGRSTPELEARVRRALTEAGDRAMSLGALPAAAHYYEQALDYCPPSTPERAAVLLRIGRSRPADPALDDALLEEASEGLAAAGDLEGAAEARLLMAGNCWVRGSSEPVWAQVDAAHALVPEGTVSPIRVQILSTVARYAMLGGDPERAIEVAGDALEISERLGRTDLSARLVLTIGTARTVIGDPGGIPGIERSIEMADAANLPHLRWIGMVNLASVLLERGDARAASRVHQQSLRMAETTGNAADIEWDRAERINYCYFSGEWGEAEERLQAFLSGSGADGHYLDGIAREVRTRIRRARGDVDGALQDSETLLRRAREIKDPQVLYPALALRADTLAAVGRHDEARRLVGELFDLWRAGAPYTGGTTTSDAAWTLSALGATDELLNVMEAKPGASRWVAAGAAVLRGDLLAAADVFEEIGSLPDEARARLRAAERLDGEQRAEQLRLARAFYDSVGATGFLRECEALEAAA
jgi:class 3 adenylate cyclase/tetratricopeptide (TPR) repeat protein